MKSFYKVHLPFINKDDMEEYNSGGKVALSPERAKFLRDLNVIGEEIATAPPPPENAAAPSPPENAEAVATFEIAAKGKIKGGK